ncbi:hypothetical protein EG328_009599 [Venturia inaequalis]|uniref:ribonuclease H n=1 Tax=Venturia inaequalis TaxID=5025 RepID=A0A8H3YQ40_VENIN|nr:hypothetical protein EG328_009599 [Venturia inaequalis]
MVLFMEVYIDGGCRGNGEPWAYGAASACFKEQSGGWGLCWQIALPRGSHVRPPTSQRAELHAVILALDRIINAYKALNTTSCLEATIKTDSRYVVGCMRTWINDWLANGFINASGKSVANRDLIERALNLDDDLASMGGRIDYVYIPREQNKMADEACCDWLDKQEMALFG